MTSSLTTRWDEFSVQVTSENSKRFFVRLVINESKAAYMHFSDVLLENGDEPILVCAFRILANEGFQISSGAELHFSDILPSVKQGAGSAEVLKRQVQIISSLESYLNTVGLKVANTIFSEKGGRQAITVYVG